MTREAWINERLDDLNGKVAAGFARVDERFDRFERDVDTRFKTFESTVDRRFKDFESTVDQRFKALESTVERRFKDFEKSVDTRFAEVNGRLDRMDERLGQLVSSFDALNQTLLRGGFALIAALVGVVVTLLGLVATQL